jgi:hypothetical protein
MPFAKRYWNTGQTILPDRRSTSASASASASELANGFSRTTLRPARRALRAWSKCSAGGVQMLTTSRSRRVSSSKSVKIFAMPCSAPTCRAFSGSMSQKASTENRSPSSR